jgi:glycolate oxidase FAD binding subunit
MSETVTPGSIAELVEIVRATPRLIPVGNVTKPRLSSVEAVRVSTQKLSGITEYDPSEFTFTALAGTPLREIVTALAARGQYLPFDPPLVDAGATLGGTVAAGLSGPGRLRFGGLRDFILGVKFVDGSGTLLRMGGKVVKNAAGFDLPKFFVGSLGRFGVMAELTFKVFPRPVDSLTLKLDVSDPSVAARILMDAPNSRWEPYALDLLPGGMHILLRLEGQAAALDQLAQEVLRRWPGKPLSPDDAESAWTQLREFTWAHGNGELIKVPLTAKDLPQLARALTQLEDVRLHASSGGNVAFISLPSEKQAATLNEALQTLHLRGLTLRGTGPLWHGVRQPSKISEAVKATLDPANRFPSLND